MEYQVNPDVYRWPSIVSAIFATATFAAFSMGYLKTELNSNILKGKLFYVTLLSYSLVAQGFIPEHRLVEDPNKNCSILAPFIEFSVIGSMAQFALLSFDLVLVLFNPFRSQKLSTILYFTPTIISMVYVLAFIWSAQGAFRHEIGLCWVKSMSEKSTQINPSMAIFLYVPMCVTYLIAAFVMFYLCYVMRCSLEIRFFLGRNITLLVELASAFIIFSMYYLIIGVMYWMTLLDKEREHGEHVTSKNGQIFAIFLSLQGVAETFSLWATNFLAESLIGTGCCEMRSNRDTRSDTPLQPLVSKEFERNADLLDFEMGMRYRVLRVLENAMVNFSENNRKVEFYGKTVKVESHCWEEFENIRESAKIDEIDYHNSFEDIATAATVDAGGASGAIFSRTNNGEYRVKGLTPQEAITLKNLMPYLRDYWVDTNPGSIIVRVYGLYSVRVLKTKIWFMVMEDVFSNLSVVHEKYDLKGSKAGRNVGKNPLSGEVLKDSDLRAPILLKNTERQEILASMRLDTKFLADHQLMDYSLLLGIQYKKLKFPEDEMNKMSRKFDRRCLLARPVIANYAFGIIDFLQEYNSNKNLEAWWKTYVYRENRLELSAIPPGPYQIRFMGQIEKYLDSDGLRVRFATIDETGDDQLNLCISDMGTQLT